MRKLIWLLLFMSLLGFLTTACGPTPSPTPVPEAPTPTIAPPTPPPRPCRLRLPRSQRRLPYRRKEVKRCLLK